MGTINCPYCGAEIREQDSGNKVWRCSHCSHSLLVEAQPLIQPIQSTTDNTALITLGSSFIWRQQRYTTQGFLRFAHAEGMRTEWLIKHEHGDDYSLIADDENLFLLQSQTVRLNEAPSWASLQPNTHINVAGKDWLVTEQCQMVLEEASASTPRPALKNSARSDAYLIAQNAEALLITFIDNAATFQQGFWLDPFEIKVSV